MQRTWSRLGFVVLLLWGCGCVACGRCEDFGEDIGILKVAVPQEHLGFVGLWVSDDGRSMIHIHQDGTASMRVPIGESDGQKEITNGAVRFGQNTLIVHILGIEEVWRVDNAPEAGKKGTMTLSGIVFHNTP